MTAQPLYELTLYVSVPQDKADYLLEKLCDTVEDYGYGWFGAACRNAEDLEAAADDAIEDAVLAAYMQANFPSPDQ